MQDPLLQATRIRELPPYLFARLDELAAAERQRGVDVINLGIGDPDLPAPPQVVEELCRAARLGEHHHYPRYQGSDELRAAVAAFYQRRFGVSLDADKEVLVLIGSKEGIAHLPVAFVESGEVVLVPDPAYPVYATTARFVGGDIYRLPLRRENSFLPDLEAIPAEVLARTRLLWVNYPNNPTAAVAGPEFFARVSAFAHRHRILVASDLAYSEVYFDEPPPSFLAAPGAMEVGIEFHSLSKTYNMTGFRVGFACGNQALIAGLLRVKTNVDSGTFEAVQLAATAALLSDQASVAELRALYRERRDLLCDALSAAGFDVLRPRATFYLLVACPPGLDAMGFATRLLSSAGIVATPATGFGACGEGFIRLTLCADKARLLEAASRLRGLRL